MTGFPPKVRQIVVERSGGYCEGCAYQRAEQIHHRRPRGMGGSSAADTNTASNALALCYPCHAGFESRREAAEKFGWLVPQGISPASRPVLRRGVWVLLDDDGKVIEQ
jgi:5-methylcytosine-specific restriction protein A